MMTGLAQMVCKQIRSKILMTGPITVAEYMKLSLTLPGINGSNHLEVNNRNGGYYMKKDVFGQQGDFITSPEISQMFGEMIAVWGLQTWQQIGGPKKINIVELGPGRGTLGKDILRVFKRFEHLTGNDVSLHLVEISPFLANIQHQTLCPSEIKTALSQQKGLPSLESRSRVIDYKGDGLSETKLSSDSEYYRHAIASESGYPVFWYKNIRDVPKEFNFYIAHEFFDALPIHKLQKVDNVWREILVDIDEEHNVSVKTSDASKFRFVASRHETPILKLLQSQYNEILSDSRNHIEISIDALEILEEICTRTNEHGGFSLVIDYGHEGTKEDTFRGFLKHALHDPLINPGSADMTADVDFSFIKKLLRDKVMICGPIAQAEFLRKTGISVRLETLTKCSSEEEKQMLISSHQMLMQDMGSRFLFMSLFPKILEQYLPKLKISVFHENS